MPQHTCKLLTMQQPPAKSRPNLLLLDPLSRVHLQQIQLTHHA